jgi:adenylate cyclase class 2
MEEIEAKFMEVDINKLRKIIKENGGKKVHKMVMYKRYVFNLLVPSIKGYIRTREENGRVTITVKTYSKESKFATEYEILLDKNSTIEDAKNLLVAQGYKIKSYQETLREKWSINGCPEIAIDTLPGIPTYVELECKNEKEIKKIAKLLGFDMKDAKYGSFVNEYIDYYGVNIEDEKLPSLTFNNIDKELKPKKNHQLLKNMKKNNLELIKKQKINII